MSASTSMDGGTHVSGEQGGHLTVATEQADYLLHPGNHTVTSRFSAETVESVDTVVLENGTKPFDGLTLDWFREQEQYRELVDRCRDVETPITVVDVPYPGPDTRLYLSEIAAIGMPCAAGILGVLHGHTALGVLALPALAFSLGGNRHSAGMNRAAGYLQLSDAYTWSGFRSAVAAEKLETRVVPQLIDDGVERPTVLVDYGAGHLDIGPYLQHPRLRCHVIRMHRSVRHVDDGLLSQVCTFRFAEDEMENTVQTATF